jgi:hypothetical protein
LFWWNHDVKRSLNNDLDLIPARALQAVGRRFDQGHVHQNCSTAFYDLCGNLNIVNSSTLEHLEQLWEQLPQTR